MFQDYIQVPRSYLEELLKIKERLENDPQGKTYDWQTHLLGYLEAINNLLK
jgi:hypothetical protein